MSYVEQNLIAGENVMYRARLHWIVLFWPIFVAVLLCAGGVAAIAGALSKKGGEVPGLGILGLLLLLAAGVVVAWGMVKRSMAEFAVTNKRVIFKVGVIRNRTLEVFLNKIESVGVDQDIAGRICGYGSIVVRGTGGSSEPFDKISKPLEFRRQVQEQISRIS